MSGTPPAPPGPRTGDPRTSKRTRSGVRAVLGAFAVATLVLLGLLPPAQPAAAASYVPISGAGSTWSQNALDQWRANVKQYGMTVNYNGTGSSDGRNQFRNGTVDYGVSEIPYGIKDSGVVDSPPSRKYAYMPIVAGGTSFMYNLRIGNQRVTNLRLSGPVIAKIFTGGITLWNDPAIKADNPGLAASLPARRIVPVVRSDGSGTTAQLTAWMAKEHGSVWDSYCAKAGRSTPCGTTSNYPLVPGKGFVAQSGSNGVSGYVAQAGNIGTITYVEYSYAVYTTGFPVAKVLNKAGYYTEPTAQNVAVSLLDARINNNSASPQYLTQILDGVYANQRRDARNYPLSSYSYMVVPTKLESNFNAQKGKTLGAFSYYFLCQGQQHVDNLGYSPLPVNLVEAGLEQVRKIPGVDVENVNIKNCRNPTFSEDGTNTLAKTAPMPPACDKQGATQCTTGTGGDKKPTVPQGGGAGSGTGGGTGGASGGGSTGGAATGGTGGAAATGGAGAKGGTASPGASASGGAAVDPDTGQPLATGGAGDAAGAGAGGGDAFAVPVSTSGSLGGGARLALTVLAALLLVVVTVGPPLLSRLLTARKSGS
ncbi:phosphate ABC transporter substrate-binding protein PstS [Streptomyces sp. NPDC058001]|uniref:phosphate ABC transporter substrate-binding protein PstS n=1 Tax=Streptomyces sp. NPDC058001 TaxID=3346300 RepID=UPI0036E1DF98